MIPFAQFRNAAAAIALLLVFLVPHSTAQRSPNAALRPGAELASKPAGPKRAVYSRAYVVDDRLSALRREPSTQSEVIQRLRIGRPAMIINARNTGDHKFCRVAVTRRTRGWIHQSSLVVPGRVGEDQRIMKLIENASDGLDRIMLCRILIERFRQSRLVPRALLLMGEEAERAAEKLSQRARKRLAEVAGKNANADLSDYYLNDSGLDRYSKLQIVFGFNQSMAEYVYDGKAYRDVVKRFPDGEEARLARQRLALVSHKLARRL